MTTEYTFIRYVPLWGLAGPSCREMRDDAGFRLSGKHLPKMPDGFRQGDETQMGS